MKTILPRFCSNHNTLEKLCHKLFGNMMETKYYREFFAHVPLEPKNNRTILIYSGISSMYLTPIEILLYHLLQSKGFKVDYYIYDENVQLNEIITRDRVEKEGCNNFWARSYKNGIRVLNAANVDYTFIETNIEVEQQLSKLPNNLEQVLSLKVDDYEVGNIVRGVMYRYYKSISFGDDALEIARKFMHTTLTNYYQIKQLHNSKEYEYVMFSHGIYCTWQIIVDYCGKNNIDYICYDRAKTKSCANFNLNKPSPVWDISATWNRLRNYELSDSEIKQVNNYISERELQKGDVYAYNFSKKEDDLATLKKKLGIRAGSKIITIFTNLIWDAANVSRDIAFPSPLECIVQTINRYKKDDVHILIRTHPAEKVLGTSTGYGRLVYEAFQNNLPKNVTVIEPEMNINSFSILDISDIGVVHTSTVGLEMAMEGKPVILISDTHYRNKGFTYDATSILDYFNIIDNQLKKEILLPDQIELARKYFYLMMFEYQHKMPLSFTDMKHFNGYGYLNFEQLLKSDSEGINKITERIINSNKKNSLKDFIFK